MPIFLRSLTGFLCLLCSVLQAQQPVPKTLLWRISGNGLQKASYLFGTMHLNDKRLFRFSDSVYTAIENTDGLAIEINPDEMGVYYVNKVFDEIENKKKLKELFSEDDFNQYREGLSKKFKKPADDITADEIVRARNGWMADFMARGEMPTFVDAYLYNIARRQGKWLGGIEDLSDQLGLMEEIVDKSDVEFLLLEDKKSNEKKAPPMLENMIKMYEAEDLQGISRMINGTDASDRDQLLIKRNVKMARRMDSLMHIRTMFLAVGAAHLPGDSGVIDLLTSRGFRVEPVMSTTKTDAVKYKFKEVHLPWQMVNDVNHLYQVSMPGNPASVRVHGLIDMKFHLDLFTMSTYSTMAVPSPVREFDKDKVMNEMLSNIFKGRKVKSVATITAGEISGKEFIEKIDNQIIRIRILMDDHMIYMVSMTGSKRDQLTGGDAAKFFSSFSVSDKPAPSTALLTHTFTDSVMGISLRTPGKLTFNKQFSRNENGWNVNGFSAMDVDKGIVTLLFSQDMMAGSYIQSDSVIEDALYGRMADQYKVIDSQHLKINGETAFRVIAANIKEKGLYTQSISVVKGNRNIILMLMGDSVNIFGDVSKAIVGSMKFMQQQRGQWESQSDPNNTFSVVAPGSIRSAGEEENMHYWLSYDTLTSTSYSIVPDTLGAYDWSVSDSSFWSGRIQAESSNVSVISDRHVNNGDIKGRELQLRKPGGGSIIYRIRLLRNGDKVYRMVVTGRADFVNAPQVDTFFQSFRFSKIESDQQFYIRSKARELLSDLTSPDSSKRLSAYLAIESAPFGKVDWEMLSESITKTYLNPYTNDTSDLVNNALAGKLSGFDDSRTLPFLKSLYHNRENRTLVLKTISQIKTSEAYASMVDLMQISLPKETPWYVYSNNLYDSIALTAAIYPRLTQFAKDTIFGGLVAEIALRLIDSNLVSVETVIKDEAAFIGLAKHMHHQILKKNEISDYRIYQVAGILSKFNSEASNLALKELMPGSPDYLLLELIELQLKNGLAVEAKYLETLVKNKSIRFDLYKMLLKLGKADLFPGRYRNQSALAEAMMINHAEFDDSPESIHFIEKRKEVVDGKTLHFYLYKIKFEDSDDAYLGIAGGFDTTSDLETAVDHTGVYWKEIFNQKKIKEYLKSYLTAPVE